jgi:CSLREA domain-containing protein
VRRRLASVAIVALVGAGGLGAYEAQAATLTVTTIDDPAGNSQCSLREAIETVNDFGVRSVCGIADGSGNTIVLGPHPYTLSLPPSNGDANGSGDLDLTMNIPTTIEGAGVGQTTISGAGFPAKNPDRLLHVMAGTVTIRDLTLSDGTAPDGADGTDAVNGMSPAPPTNGMPGAGGGAIFNEGNLALVDVAVTNNAAGNGGKGGVGETLGTGADGGQGGAGRGIYNVGTLSLTDVTLTGNHAGRGGVGGAVALAARAASAAWAGAAATAAGWTARPAR